MLSGNEDAAETETFHFVQGWPGTNKKGISKRGIKSIHETNPNHIAYQTVIENAKIFILYKKKIQTKLGELEGKDWWNPFLPAMKTLFRNKLNRLGELELVKEMGKDSYGADVVRDTYTQMKYGKLDGDKFNRDVGQIFAEAQAEATGTGGGGNNNNSPPPSNDYWKAAIREIKDILSALSSSNNIVKLPNGWENRYQGASDADVDRFKAEDLDKIWRYLARKEINKLLAQKSLLIQEVFGAIGINNSDDLKNHFANFKGKLAIETERDRLMDLIDNQQQDRLSEVQDAIDEIKQTLQNAGLDHKGETIILGNTWETNFKMGYRYKDSSDIQAEKVRIMATINDFLARESSDSATVIAEVEKMLQDSGLNESILGTDWRKKLQVKNKNERETEKNRLIKLIAEEIQRKKDTGDLSETEAEEKKKELVKQSATSAKGQIKSKLTDGHQKLAVGENELDEALAPYTTVEEKLESLTGVEEISAFENNLLAVIDQKKKEKLNNIANEAIESIKKEIGGDQDIELGANEDFENIIKGLVNPDEIENLKNRIVTLIKEQKMARGLEQTSDLSGEQPDSPTWPKMLVVAVLVGFLLATVALIIRKNRRQKLSREK
ncbi:protein of unknown function [endosymbiont DhMRE of Dentiscutata heterogama]|uniref:hypothetical protein n=1 Tax=endosymbiont DhMRE of Dentiscutata heterogama TaxID=1609546 RepID=UPI000629D890|nr:hypothetical protein [endosymbiont DhMRE of Dentiscutata heterogama]CFW93133.1 protein of unknown function [endosymbiont DhMRE of Dentiscutata heterogama]